MLPSSRHSSYALARIRRSIDSARIEVSFVADLKRIKVGSLTAEAHTVSPERCVLSGVD
jgi:hypothetical protein